MPTNQDKILKQIFLRRDWMSIKEIMEKTGLSRMSSHVATEHLIRRDLIKKKREGLYVYFKIVPETDRIIRALQRGFGDEYNEDENGNNGNQA